MEILRFKLETNDFVDFHTHCTRIIKFEVFLVQNCHGNLGVEVTKTLVSSFDRRISIKHFISKIPTKFDHTDLKDYSV